MNRFKKSKTSLFLMELIITMMFFSVCAAVCLQMFVKTHLLGKETMELNHAVAEAQCFAEIMRGTDGTIEDIMKYYPDAASDGESFFEVYYDDEFFQCDYSRAAYEADISLRPDGSIQNMTVQIMRISDNKEIYTLNATKYIEAGNRM